jgi:hypothetical protein
MAGSSSRVDAACRLLIETHTRLITYSPLCNAPSSTYTGVSFSVAGSRHWQSARKATEAGHGTILGYIPLVSHWIHPLCCTCICIVSKDHEKITSDVEGTGAGAAKGRPGAGSTHQASMATYGHTACIPLLIYLLDNSIFRQECTKNASGKRGSSKTCIGTTSSSVNPSFPTNAHALHSFLLIWCLILNHYACVH